VVVMSAWLSSQERHVRAYVKLYAAREWACLVCHSDFPTGCAGVAGAGTEGRRAARRGSAVWVLPGWRQAPRRRGRVAGGVGADGVVGAGAPE
jgi:hypothetical protein